MSIENIFVFNPNSTPNSNQLNINFDTVRTCFRSLGTGELSPAQITSNQNDYSTSDSTSSNGNGIPVGVLRLSSDASRDITGFSGGSDGRRLLLINVGSNAIVLKHQNGSSVAANRIITRTGGDLSLAADDAVQLYYDSTTQRWRVL